ncbi:MAG: FixH family protein [Thiobacillus sp.]
MNTMTSLFGGLAAVFVIYMIGGAIRSLPPILRAVLAGLIPLLAYFVLIIGRWPGLDVVAMHISVFLAAGLVLFALTQFRRHSSGRMHWAPKLLIAFFLGLVVINGTLLYISTQGLPDQVGRWWLGSNGTAVYSGFSGVVPHGQAAARAISSELSQAQREAELGWQVEISGLDDGALVRPFQVRVKDRTGLPVDRVEGELRLLRPGATQAVLVLALDALDGGTYGGVLRLPAGGRWLTELRLQRGHDVLYQDTQELVAP